LKDYAFRLLLFYLEKINQQNMIKKITKIDKKIGQMILISAVCLFVFGPASVFAEEMSPLDPSELGQDVAVGTPVEDIISSVSSGGLETNSDIRKIQADINDQAPEIFVSSEESQPIPEPAVGFNPETMQSLEEKGGLSSKPEIDSSTPTAFNLAVKFFERVVFKKDVEFSSRPTFDQGLEISGAPAFDKDTAGYAIIKKGNQSVEIKFENEYDSPPIITATLSLQQYKDAEVRAVAEDLLLVSDVKYIVTNATKKGFEIMMDRKADSDIPFSWHALAVNKPKTYKKKGSTPDSQEFQAASGGVSSQAEIQSDIPPLDSGPAAVQQSETSSILGGTGEPPALNQ
jgi:hypothetical protein